MNKLLFISLLSLTLSVTVNLESFRNDVLTRHNLYRSQHRAPNLVRHAELEGIAQSYSQTLAKLGYLVHSDNKLDEEYIGENLYAGYYMGSSSSVGNDAVDLWYSESKNYDFNNPGFGMNTGHFTQVVWKSSLKLGCGVGCNNQSYCFVTCNYYPAGNYYGEFPKNVFPKSGDAVEEEEEEETSSDTASDSTEVIVDPKLEEFRNEILNRHNYLRGQHQAGDLERDSTLESIAQKAAEYMIEIDNFSFPTDKYNGQYIGMNLFWNYGSFTGTSIADYWYSEIDKYDFNNPGYNADAGAFTQLVWKNTQKIGCGYSCKGQECYGICTYYPSGNYHGMFETNVFPNS